MTQFGIPVVRLDLIILPYFWQTWWFIGLVLMSAGLTIAITVRSIEKVKLRRRIRASGTRACGRTERARIARDFHDDLGACLSHMIVLSELVKVDKAQPNEIEIHAAKIGSTARKAVHGLGTIVWAVNPRNDTLDSLVQYISQYAYDFFEAPQIACHLDLPTEVPAIHLTAEVRHNLFMVVKEAFNNILKHSRASDVHLRLALQNGVLEIRVEDNGCGFETSPTASRRSGLPNMRQRTKMIGALLQIESQPGKGTSIRVQMTIPPSK